MDANCSEATSHMTDYEKARAVVIARNRARLESLGIPLAAEQLKKATEDRKKGNRPAKRTLPVEKDELQPQRRSKRLRSRGIADPVKLEKEDEIDQDASDLAVFIIDGECPKCGKVITRGHKKHLAMCTGKPVYDPTLKELIEIEVKKLKTQDAKLSELELGGLIELTDEHALFIVVGSTGRHYKVELSDAKRKCQCVDHRCRKHDCKHIRLLLKTLKIEQDPKSWHIAVDQIILEQGANLKEAGQVGSVQAAGPKCSHQYEAASKYL